MKARYPVGIDLGTTLSAAAYVNKSGVTQMILNAEGEILTPSVALFKREEIVIGRDAKRACKSDPGRVAEMAKRDMGQTHYRNPIQGQWLPPEVIQGCVLRKLRSDIVAAIGESHQVVITVPAYFDEPRRKATADTGQMSGLTVMDILNEPTAAALAFGEQLGYLDAKGAPSDALTLLVYDLGGGTFDVTAIRLEPGSVTTLATDGDVELGGYNWDMRIVEHLIGRFQDRYPNCPDPDEATRAQLRQSAEAAKHELSTIQKTTVQVDMYGQSVNVSVSRHEFETMTAELVERTKFTTNQTLKAAGLLWSDIDRLLLVGGSTRVPMIRRALENVSGMTPDINVNPDEAVARGAAIYARHLFALRGTYNVPVNLKVVDVNAHSLGMEAISQETLRKENVVLIPRNTALPFELHRIFVTRKDNQQSVKIQLLEGESSLPGQCTALAKAAIRNLPIGLAEGTEIDVCYRFEANGRLSVEAQLPSGGHEAKIELERVRGLTDERVVKWKNIICRDGGFDNFEDSVQDLLANGDKNANGDQLPENKEAHPAQEKCLEPAVPYGAPAEASDALKRERNVRASVRKHRNSDKLPLLVVVVGHIMFSALGLAIGYYVLCWLNPERNFLNIDLPGLEPPSSRVEP